MAGPALAVGLSGIPIAGPIIGGFVGGLVDQLWMPRLFGKTKQPLRAVDIDMSLATDGTPGTLVYGLWGRVPLHRTWGSLPWSDGQGSGRVNKRRTPEVVSWYAQSMWVAAQRPIFEFDQLIFDGRRVYTATLDRDVVFTARAPGSTTTGCVVTWEVRPPVNTLRSVTIQNTRDGSGDPTDADLARELSEYDIGGTARLVVADLYHSGGNSPDPGGADDWVVSDSRIVDAKGNGLLKLTPRSLISGTIPAHWTSYFTTTSGVIHVVAGTACEVDGLNVQYDPKVFPSGASSVEFRTAGTTKSSILTTALGAADTPNFRSSAYVVTDQLNLSSFGNRMPNAAAVVRGYSTGNLIYLDKIVEDMCEVWGRLGSDEFDLAGVPTNSIHGLTVFMPFEPAEEIEKLMAAYRLLWQEGSDATGRAFGRFILREDRDEVELDIDEFNARRPGESPTDDPFEVERIDLSERLRRVEVSFRDLDNGWQRGVEVEQLQHSLAGNEVRLQLDELTLTRAEGRSIARESLRESWARSKRVEWSGSYLQWNVQEDDIVSWTDDDGREWVVVVDEITESPDRFLDFAGYAIPREEIGAALTSEGSTIGEDPRYDTGNPKIPAAFTPLEVEVFETAPLRDEHIGVPGVYIAASRYGSAAAFLGGVVFLKRPADSAWRQVDIVQDEATMGQATTALATVADVSVYDETNEVSVLLDADAEVSSVTTDETDIGANLALLGDEVIAFASATLEPDGTYALATMRRGALATEGEVGSHVAGERFVLLDDNVLFLRLSREDEGSTIQIRVVPPGATIEDVPIIEHEVQLLTCKPVGPADVALDDPDNTLVVTWSYRSARALRYWSPTFTPREAGEMIELRFFNSNLAGAGSPVHTVRVPSYEETYTLDDPYGKGLTASTVSVHAVVVTDTFGESVESGAEITGVGFVEVAPEELAEVAYVDGTTQAVTAGTMSVATTDKVVAADAASGAISVNLPPAATATRLLTVVKVDSSVNLVTIYPDGSETIDGASTRTLSSQWASVNLISDGTEWFTA